MLPILFGHRLIPSGLAKTTALVAAEPAPTPVASKANTTTSEGTTYETG